MPGWHEATRKLRDAGRFQMVGIVQEQHPDRARLFMQYQQMDWPVLVDPLDLLGVSVVPITLAIDEHGIIRMVNPRPGEIERSFLNREFEKPGQEGAGDSATVVPRPSLDTVLRVSGSDEELRASRRAVANNQVMSGDAKLYDEAIQTYRELLQVAPDDGSLHFSLGVAYRKRYDSDRRQPGDFSNAIKHWAEALQIDPNNYIWRRRIQQYGPRLSKPYPFYDWVTTARKQIAARGETPVPLVAEPGEAEIAKPARSFRPHHGSALQEPDPRGRVARDERTFIEIETVVVPPTIKSGASARVHVVLRPNARVKAHWNNEAEGLALWIDPPAGWQVDRRYLAASNPGEPTSTEPRTIEFEIRCPQGARPGSVPFSAYALYNVCEGATGKCLYRRQDLNFSIEVTPLTP